MAMTSSTYLPVDPRPASLAADLLFREGPEEDRAELRNAGAGGREDMVHRSRRAVEEAQDGH
jgi:hypothetical protein